MPAEEAQTSPMPRQVQGIKAYAVLDELILYSPDQEKAFSFNHSARAVWELCDGRQTVTEICQTLAQQFDCRCDEIIDDIKATLRQLHDFGLIE